MVFIVILLQTKVFCGKIIFMKKTDVINENYLDDNKALPPLAERMRPRVLSEFVGQKHLIYQVINLMDGYVQAYG